MTPFSTTRSGAEAAIAEVVANARVRQRFPAFIKSQAADLFVYAGDKAHVRAELKSLLQLGSPDPAVVHRGLLIQLNGIFEGFVKSLVSTHISAIAAKVDRFGDLEPDLQTTYSVHAARALSKLSEGSINGVSYNFAALQSGMGSCFSGGKPFVIDGEVFTLLMGNCTADRVERLFKQIGLAEPFGEEVGRHKAAQKWSGEAGARRTSARVRDELDRQIETRNDLVHGLATKDVVLLDVERAADFFGCLVTVYCDLAEGIHAG